MPKQSVMWNERYAEPGFAYGQEPNEFVVNAVADIKPCPALCLAAGEGRNAVFLAELGFEVTAVDQSTVGLAKAEAMALEREVSIKTIASDLADFDLGVDRWGLIISVFAHVPAAVRREIHSHVKTALLPGGRLVLEAYTPSQVGRGTGGPPVAELTMSAAALREELGGLDLTRLAEVERDVVEGRYHTGGASVVQLVGVRRADEKV